MAAVQKTSKRGIPVMDVVEDVAKWLKDEGELTPEQGVRKLEEQYQKYQMVQGGLTQQRIGMLEKIPSYQNSLQMIDVLMEKKAKEQSFETTYMLAEEVYTKAVVEKPEKIAIWVGANVMVEYELDKAKEFIEQNRDRLQKLIDDLNSELDFLKDQITTTEVNMAHLHNHRVKQRQMQSKLMGQA